MPALLLEDGFVLLLEEDADASTAPVSADLVWSMPEDRNARVAAAAVAVRQTVTVGEESDVRLVFTATGDAAEAADLTSMTLRAYVAANVTDDPILTLTEGSGVTTNGATECEVAFAAADADDLPAGTYVVSLYDVQAGTRTWLAQVLLTVRGTALNP